MYVFAFDRDWTVDVNSHPRKEAVPLEWVRHLAHETEHAVYAIGNQTLAEEAAIPGVVDIVGRHPDAWADWLGAKQPDGYYEQFPTRRERLSLIADLHPDAEGYVVVDDIDLSDADGWNHYHAWEFVPAVERGELDPTLPWARDPVPDGGLPTMAGMIPADASDLASFLDEYSDAPGFELRYRAEGEEEESTALVWNVSQDAVRREQPGTEPTITCTPLSSGSDQFTVSFDAIERVSVVDPPPEAFTADANTPTEQATALRRLADAKPKTVRVSSVLTLLDQDDPSSLQQRDALRALRVVATLRPEECTPAIPILRSLLGDADLVSPHDALATLRAIGEHDAAEIAPAADEISPYLESNRVPARREAAGCLAAIATEFPSDVVVGNLDQNQPLFVNPFRFRHGGRILGLRLEQVANTAGHVSGVGDCHAFKAGNGVAKPVSENGVVHVGASWLVRGFGVVYFAVIGPLSVFQLPFSHDGELFGQRRVLRKRQSDFGG